MKREFVGLAFGKKKVIDWDKREQELQELCQKYRKKGAGFDCLRVYPNPKIERQLDKIGLIEYGQPYFGWMSAMVLVPIKLAIMFDAPFIMYAEEREVEYGGSTELKYTPLYTLEHVKRLYLSGVERIM